MGLSLCHLLCESIHLHVCLSSCLFVPLSIWYIHLRLRLPDYKPSLSSRYRLRTSISGMIRIAMGHHYKFKFVLWPGLEPQLPVCKASMLTTTPTAPTISICHSAIRPQAFSPGFLLTVMHDCSSLMRTLMSFQIKASPIEQVIKRLRRRRTSEAVNYLWKHSCAARSSIRGLVRKQIRGEARLYSQRQKSTLKQPFNRKSLEHFDTDAVIREMQRALPILFDVLLAILQPFSKM